jgi:hypothetical protein
MEGFYAREIARAIGTEDPATLAVVEELMRTDRTGLDGLRAAEFTVLARQAHRDMHTLDAAGALIEYCDALGLAVPERSLN